MSNQYIGLPPDGTGKKLDTEELTVGSTVVQREREQIAGREAGQIADVLNTDPTDTSHGLVVRVGGTVCGEILARLRTIASLLARPLSIEPGTGRQRVTIEAGAVAVTGPIAITGAVEIASDMPGALPALRTNEPEPGAPGLVVRNFHQEIASVSAALKTILNLLVRPISVEQSTGRARVTIEAGTLPLVTSVTTVATVTSITNLAGFSAKETLLNSLDRTLWYTGVRGRIN